MLDLDSSCDASSTEDVFAVSDDGVGRSVIADGAIFLALDVEAQGFLKKATVLVVKRYDILVLQKGEKVFDAILAESPVIATVKGEQESFMT